MQPPWSIVRYREGLNLSSLHCHAVEEFPTANGPADYALFVGGKLLGILEAKKVRPTRPPKPGRRTSGEIIGTNQEHKNMSEPGKETRVKAFVDWCQNHKLVSVIIIIGLMVIALAQFTEALDTINKFFKPDKPAVATSPRPTAAEETALYNEAQFRIKQVDEVLQTAISQGKQCLAHQKAKGSIPGADIRDYLTSAQVVRVASELGGIYRNPGLENDTVQIGSSGYGLRQLPEKSGCKDGKFKERNLCDIARDYSNLQNQKSDMSCPPDVRRALEDLKGKAQFTQTATLDDWFKRHQAQGIYKAKYRDAYKVYEMQVDDYGDEIAAMDAWVHAVQESWSRVKTSKAIALFISQ